MPKFRKKPVVIEAHQWHQHSYNGLVQVFNRSALGTCKHCHADMHTHGWIETLEGGHIVCPGDWIIPGVEGEHYPCKPDIFEKTYELVEGAE